MALKKLAISGAIWSFAGSLLQQLSAFVIGVVLARLLTPAEYGLVGMAGVFIYISYVFVDSGFSLALIQRYDCKQKDYTTIFYANLVLAIIVYALIYVFAPKIAAFYSEESLISIVRILGLLVLLYGFSLVQNAIISRNVNFKLSTQVHFISTILSGAIGIFMAYKGHGVWALVWKTLLNQVFINIQLWIRTNWWPTLEFSKQSFREMFSFSYKLIISGFIRKAFDQVYILVVGKFFSASELGLFTRADHFQKLPSVTLSGSITKFALPIFSKMQKEPQRLKSAFKRVSKTVMFFNASAMVGLAVIAEPMVLALLGENWIGTVVYLQLLCIAGLFFPLQQINIQAIAALGRSDLFLKIEILKKILFIPAILLGIFIGIKAMIIGMILSSFMNFYINAYYLEKVINYGFWEQVIDILPVFILSLLMGAVVFGIGLFCRSILSPKVELVLEVFVGVVATLIILFKLKPIEINEIQTVILQKLGIKKN